MTCKRSECSGCPKCNEQLAGVLAFASGGNYAAYSHWLRTQQDALLARSHMRRAGAGGSMLRVGVHMASDDEVPPAPSLTDEIRRQRNQPPLRRTPNDTPARPTRPTTPCAGEVPAAPDLATEISRQRNGN